MPSVSNENEKCFYGVYNLVENEYLAIRTYYTVHWYCYVPQEDTIEPNAHIAVILEDIVAKNEKI